MTHLNSFSYPSRLAICIASVFMIFCLSSVFRYHWLSILVRNCRKREIPNIKFVTFGLLLVVLFTWILYDMITTINDYLVRLFVIVLVDFLVVLVTVSFVISTVAAVIIFMTVVAIGSCCGYYRYYSGYYLYDCGCYLYDWLLSVLQWLLLARPYCHLLLLILVDYRNKLTTRISFHHHFLH